MNGRQEFWSFLVPWTGGLLASWGDLSIQGIAWAIVVIVIVERLHARIVRSPQSQAEAEKQ